MVSFVESSGVKAVLTVLIVAQAIILSLHFDGVHFSFNRSNKTTVNIHANDDTSVSYIYTATMTTQEESINQKGEFEGDTATQQQDLANDLRILLPKTEKATNGPTMISAKSTKGPTAKSTNAPTAKSTNALTAKSTKARTTKSTKSGKSSATTAILEGLTMTLSGISTFPPTTQTAWEESTKDFSEASNNMDESISNFDTTIAVTGFSIIPNSILLQRRLQEGGVIVEYTQTMMYETTDTNITAESLATEPFGTLQQREEFATTLIASDDPILQNVTTVSGVTVPRTSSPTATGTPVPSTATPTPSTPAPPTPAPATPTSSTQTPDTQTPDTPAPDTSAPDTPAPSTPNTTGKLPCADPINRTCGLAHHILLSIATMSPTLTLVVPSVRSNTPV
jgi:hypothetical protein